MCKIIESSWNTRSCSHTTLELLSPSTRHKQILHVHYKNSILDWNSSCISYKDVVWKRSRKLDAMMCDYFDCFISFFNCHAGTSGSTVLVYLYSHALHYCNYSLAGNNCIFVPVKNILVTTQSTRVYTKALHFVHAMFLGVPYNSYIKQTLFHYITFWHFWREGHCFLWDTKRIIMYI